VVTDPNAIVSETVGPWHFWFYAGGFFQNNPFVLNHLVEYVAKGVAGEGLETLLDIYCGIGIFGIASHKGFQKVIGVEIDPEAISLATHNASINGAKNCTFVPGQAESILANFLENPLQTAVILDPPRKGCDKKLLEQLITLAPQRIVYISCSPDTQARDLKILLDSGRFRIEKIQPFDLFPQTRHIENVVTVERVG
jgi:23S rRNA (uracil1939-C5)-methyltransferase/tRNA (uracil-5-)-methyltransferase